MLASECLSAHWLLGQQLGVTFDDVPSLLNPEDATKMSRDRGNFVFPPNGRQHNMTSGRNLFGGAITMDLPFNFIDASYVIVWFINFFS